MRTNKAIVTVVVVFSAACGGTTVVQTRGIELKPSAPHLANEADASIAPTVAAVVPIDPCPTLPLDREGDYVRDPKLLRELAWSHEAIRAPLSRAIEGRFLVGPTKPFLVFYPCEGTAGALEIPASAVPSATLDRLANSLLRPRYVTVSATPLGRSLPDTYLVALRTLELDDGEKLETHVSPTGADYATLSEARIAGTDAIGKTVEVIFSSDPFASWTHAYGLVAGGVVGWATSPLDPYGYEAASVQLALAGMSDGDLDGILRARAIKVRIDAIVSPQSGVPDLRLSLTPSKAKPSATTPLFSPFGEAAMVQAARGSKGIEFAAQMQCRKFNDGYHGWLPEGRDDFGPHAGVVDVDVSAADVAKLKLLCTRDASRTLNVRLRIESIRATVRNADHIKLKLLSVTPTEPRPSNAASLPIAATPVLIKGKRRAKVRLRSATATEAQLTVMGPQSEEGVVSVSALTPNERALVRKIASADDEVEVVLDSTGAIDHQAGYGTPEIVSCALRDVIAIDGPIQRVPDWSKWKGAQYNQPLYEAIFSEAPQSREIIVVARFVHFDGAGVLLRTYDPSISEDGDLLYAKTTADMRAHLPTMSQYRGVGTPVRVKLERVGDCGSRGACWYAKFLGVETMP